MKVRHVFIGFIFLVGCCILLNYSLVSADTVIHHGDYDMKNGVIKFKTKDKIASTETTWRTVGLTVKSYAVNRTNPKTSYQDCNPLIGKKGTIEVEESYKYEIPIGGGYQYTQFTLPEEVVEEAYEDAGINANELKKNGGNIYLNGIFQVFIGGKPENDKQYKTLYGIEHAKTWGKSNDFFDHFNVQVPYHPKSYKVYITTMKFGNGKYYKVGKSKLMGEYPAHSIYPKGGGSLTDVIPATIESASGGTTHELYLYKTFWCKLKEEPYEHGDSGEYRTPKDTVTLSMPGEVNPLVDWNGYKTALQKLRNRNASGKESKITKSPFYEVVQGGIQLVYVYKNVKSSIQPQEGVVEEMSEEILEPTVIQAVQADNRFDEKFNSEQGIPTSESQYVCTYTDEYLFQYRFVHYSGSKEFYQKVKKKLVPVKRTYSYWKIEDLNIYSISYARISNYSLPMGGVYLTPNSYYNAPSVNYQVNSSNYIEPASGGPSVEQYTVWNDSLVFNGEVIMDDRKCMGATSSPRKIPKSGGVNAYALYQSGLVIDATKTNGEYSSNGHVSYQRIAHYGADAEGPMIAYEANEINDVTIHTPVICDAKIEDVRKYNQLIKPDTSLASLVLDTNFHVNLPTKGYHSDLKGYGNRDYGKYTASREVKFPFDVVKEKECRKANTWIPISDTTEFYLPVWVNEGQYTVEFRTRTINCDANGGITKTEDLANTDFDNYVATDTVEVEVSGRLYNFNLYDVSDYPMWQSVFRNKDSLSFTGVNYTVGTKDRNGMLAFDWTKQNYRKERYILPLINGSHPIYSTIGAIKPGYYTRFSVNTIGNYDGMEDYIRIIPKFYFITRDGTKREEVDVYYTGWRESDRKRKILVKVGSELDQKNIHCIDRKDRYLVGGGIKGTPCTKQTIKNVYTFGNIMIPNALMNYLNNKSMQTWFCEYYLPTNLYICKKDYDVVNEVNDRNGIDFSEEFWLKDGYLMVNLQIETIQDNKRHLSYINADNVSDGYCNMWKLEGGVSNKQDGYGAKFEIRDGDYVMYDIAKQKNANLDYIAGGLY